MDGRFTLSLLFPLFPDLFIYMDIKLGITIPKTCKFDDINGTFCENHIWH